MPRALDELADALRALRTDFEKSPFVASLKLRHQFGSPLTPELWKKLESFLNCPLPPLVTVPESWLWTDEEWELPAGWETVSDAASHLARHYAGAISHSDWRVEVSQDDWREAQIFAGVRQITSDQLCIPKSEIHRHSRFVEDLKAD